MQNINDLKCNWKRFAGIPPLQPSGFNTETTEVN